jgi:hypothetical protein
MPNKWGASFWTLFHVLTIKYDEKKVSIKEILNFINGICNVLPCIICRSHAIKYIRNYNIKKIITKNDLQKFVLNFHNSVNIMLKRDIFKFEQLNIYNKYNIINAYNSFFSDYNKQYGSNTEIINKHDMLQLIKTNKQWIVSNINNFNENI